MDKTGLSAAQPDGIILPPLPVVHREEDYDPAGFALLAQMQARHFWYRGRHRFVAHALQRALRGAAAGKSGLKGIDLGGGCGGWVRYLLDHRPGLFDELALGDSSLQALRLAKDVVGPGVSRYQIDLLNLPWKGRWDVAFLLDVLEHLHDDRAALRQIREALRPGGLLIVTTPALGVFWTYNDVLARHVRRYSRQDFTRLAAQCGYEVGFTRYFHFLLSPLFLLSRMRSPDVCRMSEEQIREHLAKTHRVPSWPFNQILTLIFALESPLGVRLAFPWGTSVLAALRRPN